MLGNIPIEDNYQAITQQYRLFKKLIYNAWCNANEYSLSYEEAALIKSIENIIRIENKKELNEENSMRIIIGAATLSKYSISNEEKCVIFFNFVEIPISQQKRKFFFKSVVKRCKNAASPWDTFLTDKLNSILPMKNETVLALENDDDIRCALMFIESIFDNGLEIAEKYSIAILSHLLQIIKLNSDLREQFEKATHLFSRFFSYFHNNRFYDVALTSILSWKEEKSPKNILTALLILFENNVCLISNNIFEKLKTFIESEDVEIQNLAIMNALYCYMNNSENAEIFSIINQKIFQSNDISCFHIQNVIFLIKHFPHMFKSQENSKFLSSLIKNTLAYLSGSDESIQENIFKLLNICISSTNALIPMEIINKLFGLFDYLLMTDVVCLMDYLMEEKKELFVEKLIASLVEQPFASLNYLSKSKSIDSVKISLKEKLFDPVNNLMKVEENEIRKLVPKISFKISHICFYQNLHNFLIFLQCDPSESVRISILKNIQPPFSNEIIETTNINLFECLLNDYSSKIRKETVKLLCRLSKLDQFSTFSLLHRYLILDIAGISPNKLAESSSYLPYIFEAFPNYLDAYFQQFYEFSMKYMRNQNSSCIIFEQKFYEITFCSFTRAFNAVFRNKTDNDKITYEVLNFCIDRLQIGLTKKETYGILILIEQILCNIGVSQSQKYSNLFTVVFKTGLNFMSSKIHQLIFKILGFIGAQPLLDDPQPIYIVENHDSYKYNIGNLSNPRNHTIFYFRVCADSLFLLLDDKSTPQLHFSILASIGEMMSLGKFTYNEISSDFKRYIPHFMRSLSNSGTQDKPKYVDLLKHLIKIPIAVIKEFTSDLVKALIDLWNYGSITIVSVFAFSLAVYFLPYLNMIIPLIRSHEKSDIVVQSLVSIALSSSLETHFTDDIVDIFIQLASAGNVEALEGLRILAIRFCLSKHVLKMYFCCLNCLSKDEFHENAVQLLYNLALKYADNLKDFREIVSNRLENYLLPSEAKILALIFERKACHEFLDEKDIQLINTKIPNHTIVCSPPVRANITNRSFFALFENVSAVNDEANSLNIEQWMKDVFFFCIKNSPSLVISSTFKVAQNSQLFPRKIFNIAFHSLFYFFMNEIKRLKSPPKAKQSNISTQLNNLEKGIQNIPKAILKVLHLKNIPSLHYGTLTDLIEFMDRSGLPLFEMDKSCILTSILAYKPPLSLRYALLQFDCFQKNDFDNAFEMLSSAFLRAGTYEQYVQFTKLFGDPEKSQLINKITTYPIYTHSLTDTEHIKLANEYFSMKKWDNFNKEISKCQSKVVFNLFKAASLLAQNEDKNTVDNYINSGFKALGDECGPNFSQGFTSALPSIIYAQQLTELKEINDNKDNCDHRFNNAKRISSSISPILLMRIAAKGDNKYSNDDKIRLLSIYRKSNDWQTMKTVYHRFFNEENSPIEAQLEIMRYKIQNNLATEEEIDLLIQRTNNEFDVNHNNKDTNSNFLATAKFQKATFLARKLDFSSNARMILQSVCELCNSHDNIKVVRLWSWANMRLYKLNNEFGMKIDIQSLENAISGFIKGALLSCGTTRISDMSMIISITFMKIVPNIEEHLSKLPLYFFIDSVDQILSNNLLNLDISFKKIIINLLEDLVSKYPCGVIYSYMFSIMCDNRILNGKKCDTPIKEIEKKCVHKIVFEDAHKITDNLAAVSSSLCDLCIDYATKVSEYITEELKGSHSLNDRKWFDRDIVNSSEKKFKSNLYSSKYDQKFLQEHSKEFEELKKLTILIKNKNIDLNSLERTSFQKRSTCNNTKPIAKSNLPNSGQKLINPPVSNRSNRGKVIDRNLALLKLPGKGKEDVDIGDIVEAQENEMNYKQQLEDLNKELAEIDGQMRSIRKTLREFEKNEKSIDLFSAAPPMEKMVDLHVPVFGTYRHNEGIIYIHSFEQKADFVVSKQRPKKITVIGSDGHRYKYLLKAREDLRLDQRVMQFLNLLNNGFLRTKIVTYSITPLTTAVGVIQWVNETSTLRDMILNYRRSHFRGAKQFDVETEISILGKECEFHENIALTRQEGIKIFNQRTNPQRDEVFRTITNQTECNKNDLREAMWITAPDSETWMKYKLNFTATAAATSIAGYIIGLGDRHMSNLLLNIRNGALLHIDYGDSFEKTQERTEFPEKVPFRLTKMMIAAFGPCGASGSFLSYCVDALATIREHQEEILNALIVFSKSPLQKEGVCYALTRSNSEISSHTPQLSKLMQRMKEKVIGTDSEILQLNQKNQLSVNEQAKKLIEQASNEYYWGTSYHGWAPWW